MSLIYRSPMSLFLNRMFEDDLMLFPSYMNHQILLSETDNKKGYLLEVPIPGMTKENVKLQLDNNLIYINVEKSSKYQYVQQLPSDVDVDSIDAIVENGLLTIEFKKLQKHKTIKDIKIR
jgi:HSP20 family molecular chaperone IbpA